MTRMLLLIFAALMLTACSGGDATTTASTPQAETDDAVRAVERYLTAKVARDEATVRALLCADMEADLAREVAAFATVTDAQIENLTCTRSAGQDTVTCTGEIVASYGADAEPTKFELSTYRVVQEDGEWKWCGEGE